MNYSIIIPARNEEQHIASVVEQAKHYGPVIVVDDGSRDGTASCAEQSGAIVLRHAVNLGKGAALKTGCDYALMKGAEAFIVLDADGQHEPKEIPSFVEALKTSDIVFGSRKVPEAMPMVLKFGNAFLSTSLRMLYGIRVKDTQCGYRAFTAAAYKSLRWEATDYFVESEMVIKVGKGKLNYGEIPIQTIYSDRYKGTTVLDGVLIVSKMIFGKVTK